MKPRIYLPFPLSNICVFILMIVYSIPIYFIAPFDRSKKVVDAICRNWMKFILWSTGVYVPVELRDQLPDDKPYIVMANHQSHLDVVLLIAMLRKTPKFVAKQELLFVPVFGLTMLALGHITINRRNREKAIASLDRAGQKIRSGTSVLVFPEGTRFDAARDRLGEFKKGGFMLALNAGVPILPVGIAGTAMRMPRGAYSAFPGPVCYRIGQPIPTEGLTDEDRDSLMEDVHAAILEQKMIAFADLETYTS